MRIEHIAMWCKDLEESKNFFVKYFNGKANRKYHNVNTGFTSYFISFDDGSRLELMHNSSLKEEDRTKALVGYAHMAFSVGSEEKVDELTKELQKDGYKLVSGPRVTGDGYYESCIVDNDGNLIEITE